MALNQNKFPGEVRYTRELGLRQVVSLGLRASLPVLAFLVLGPMTAASGLGATLALLVGGLLWFPTVLSYVELAANSSEGGIYEIVERYRPGLLPFLAGWILLLSDLLASGLLAFEAAKLLQPWTAVVASGLSTELTASIWTGIALGLALLVAVLRRRPWRRADDLFLLGGLVAVLITVIAALTVRPSPGVPGTLPDINFRTVVSGGLLVVLVLLGVEAVGEWKAEMRRADQDTPTAILATVTVSVLGTFVLLLSGLRLDAVLLAQAGMAAVVADLPQFPMAQVAGTLFAIVLIASASSLLLHANRMMRQFARAGYLPRVRLPSGPLNSLFALLVLAGLSGAFLLVPRVLAFDMLGGLVVVLSIIICGTAIVMRPLLDASLDETPAGSGQRQAFRLPFPPLIPGLGIAVAVFLVFTLGWQDLLGVVVALTVGAVIYLLYGRRGHQREEQSRTTFRRRPRQRSEREGDQPHPFRILVPLLDKPSEQRALIKMATAMAASEQGEVLPLQVIIVPPQNKRSEGERLARESYQLLQWSFGESDGAVPVAPMCRIGRDPVQAIMDSAREEDCDLILLHWQVAGGGETAVRLGSQPTRTRLVNELVRGAPCMVAAFSGELEGDIRRIVVPTAGGPHAPVAARLALGLAQYWGAQVVGLTIVRDDADEAAMALARQRVVGTFAGLPGADDVEVCLVASGQPIAVTLVEQADEHADLVMLGASNEGLLDRVLFGDIPQQVAEQTTKPAVMVRAERPAQEALFRLAWDRVQTTFPTLDNEEQIALYRDLRRGARPNINFFVLIVLSAVIATLGLWQNSAAVIIGAMLVAPLMTPILATSLGIVMGDARTIRVAAEATVKGVLLAIGIAAFITILLPEERIGGEILGRTAPTFVDLGVALASGAAGAYALGRKEVSAALPGVAIAAALMPPLCTVGIGLASFGGAIAGGAMLLFTTNLIAITVAGGLVFLLLGMRPRRGEQERTQQFRRGLIVALALLVVISIPLTWLGLRSASQFRNENTVNDWLGAAARSSDALLLEASVNRRGKELNVQARIQTTRDGLDQGTVDAWTKLLADKTGHPVHLVIDVLPVIQLEASEP